MAKIINYNLTEIDKELEKFIKILSPFPLLSCHSHCSSLIPRDQEIINEYILLNTQILSMKEVGEGLQDQMNSMMGALQELKLLQVQTALEQLEISGEQNQVYSMVQNPHCQNGWETSEVRHWSSQQAEKSMAVGKSLDNSSLATSRGSSAASSLSMPGTRQSHQVLVTKKEVNTRQISSSILSTVDTWSAFEPRLTCAEFQRQYSKDVTNVTFDQEKCINDPLSEEEKDWTSSLMSQSRNRQPLVLGDNIFADLVGNWLDLPELEKNKDTSGTHLNTPKTQEIYKKFSLTTNFFKKFLRSVRPDRDKLLKEKPGWLQTEEQTTEIFKRPKKLNKQKSIFYFPSHNDIKSTYGRIEKPGKKEVKETAKLTMCAKNGQKENDRINTGFDMNTVVWV
ncbi:PAK4-inhibitor INKA2 [Pelodytes ibericus]